MGVNPVKPRHCFIKPNLHNILNPLLTFQWSLQHLYRSRFHLKKSLFLWALKFYDEIAEIESHRWAPLLILVLLLFLPICRGFCSGSAVKNRLQYRSLRRHGLDPWVGKIPWRRAWQPTPVFLPGESHGQWSLVGYSPWGGKGLDMTEATSHTQLLYSLKS